MGAPRGTSLRLRDLQAVYSERETSPRPLALFNAIGFSGWIGAERALLCFTLKSLVFFGPLRLRALHLAGLTDSSARVELIGAPNKPEGLVSYVWRALVLFFWGVTFDRVGNEVRLRKDREPSGRSKAVGSFALERRSSD